MRKVLIWIVVVVAAFVLGVGAATGAGSLLRVSAAPADNSQVLQAPSIRSQPPEVQPESITPIQLAQTSQADPTPQPTPSVRPGAGWYDGCGWYGGSWSNSPGQSRNWQGTGGYRSGMMGDWNGQGMMGGWGGRGMGGWGWNQPGSNAERISIQDAVEAAKAYAASYGSGLEVAEVMEFSQNFYVVVREADTGRGAFELLVDPYSGAVYPEMGPNMMWNLQYGHMGSGVGDSALTVEEARQLAQQALDANLPGAVIEGEGTAFYGYYTFDYTMDNQIAGMLSVNGLSGDVWPHTWHGDFINEEEF